MSLDNTLRESTKAKLKEIERVRMREKVFVNPIHSHAAGEGIALKKLSRYSISKRSLKYPSTPFTDLLC